MGAVSSSMLRRNKRLQRARTAFQQRPDLAEIRNRLDITPPGALSPATDPARILRFGAPFFGAFPASHFQAGKRVYRLTPSETSFESIVGVSLFTFEPTKRQWIPLGTAKLGFQRGAICVEALQGNQGTLHVLKSLQAHLGIPWAHLIMKKIEAVARRTGYRQVRLADVDSLEYFKKPLVSDLELARLKRNHPEAAKLSTQDLIELAHQNIRNRMKKLYGSMGARLGYARRQGRYFVKKLDA